MTEREAVEKLKAYLKCQSLQVKGIYEDCNNKKCDNCDLCYMQGTTGEHLEAIEMAIQALEKQIAEKVKNSGERIPFEWYCPICGELLCDDGYKDTDIKYCDNCGQKLDWSDEE